MQGKLKKLRDDNGNYVYPISVSDGVFVDSAKTLKTKLSEMDTAISNASGGTGGGSNVQSWSSLPHTISGDRNLIDTSAYTLTNKVIEPNGTTWTLSNQMVTDFIQVTPNTSYVKNFKAPIAFYDKDKNILAELGLAQIQDFKVPNDSRIVYMKTSVPTQEVNPMMYKETIKRSNAFIKHTGKVAIEAKDFVVNSYTPNSEIPLFIETPVSGENQPIHPSVKAFATAWNGYKYWMAYTPFPNGTSPASENPCIAVSNDAIKWVTPTGLVNPIVPAPANAGYENYNSDTELVYNPDTGLLECWYREVLAKVENIKRVKTSDGINWSSPEMVITTSTFAVTNTEVQIISPTVVYENATYKLWVYDSGAIRHYQSTDAVTWADKGFVKVEGQLFGNQKLYSWHLHVFKNNLGQLEMINNDGARIPEEGVLTHFLSDDGINWRQTGFYMTPTWGSNKWDNWGMYRSCLFQSNGKYYLIYTGLGKNRYNNKAEWKLGLAISKDETIHTLSGIDRSYKSDMAQPARKNPVGNIGDYVYDTTLNKMIFCVDKNGVRTWVDANGTII